MILWRARATAALVDEAIAEYLNARAARVRPAPVRTIETSFLDELEDAAGAKRRRAAPRVPRGPRPDAWERTTNAGGKMSREKGRRFEKEAATAFAAWHGCEVKHTPGSGAWGTVHGFGPTGDLVFADPLAPYHVECKNVEGWCFSDLLTGYRKNKDGIEAWWRQLEAQAPPESVPLLVFTRNRLPAFVMARVSVLNALDPTGWWHLHPHMRVAACDDGPERAIMLLEHFCTIPPHESAKRYAQRKVQR